MIIFSIYDRLGSKNQKDYVSINDNVDIIKRDILSRYRKLLADKNTIELDKFKDHNIIFYGEINNGVMKVYDKDLMKDISLISFLGISEEKTNECKSN